MSQGQQPAGTSPSPQDASLPLRVPEADVGQEAPGAHVPPAMIHVSLWEPRYWDWKDSWLQGSCPRLDGCSVGH